MPWRNASDRSVAAPAARILAAVPASSATHDFAADCRSAARALRDSLRSLYASVGADPMRPQEVSRRFKLNKNLTWKIAKVLQTHDPLEAVPLVPGGEGLGILLAAMEAAGAAAPALADVRARMADFDRMIETHVGDRGTLELLMDGITRTGKPLELSRKLAFRGNSGVWGIQARVRSMTQFLAPNARNPAMLDFAIVAGWHDIRRLRSAQGWPVFRFLKQGREGTELTAPRVIEPVEPPAAPDDPSLMMRSFCSPPDAAVRTVRTESSVQHELADGPIGQRGAMTLVFGLIERAAHSRYAEQPDGETEWGEMSALVTMPAEHLMIDLLVHRDLMDGFEPEAVVYGRPFGTLPLDHASREHYRLPIEGTLDRLDPAGGGMASDLVPDEDRIVRTTVARAGWRLEDFTAFRVQVQYPPMPSTVMVRYALPRAPRH